MKTTIFVITIVPYVVFCVAASVGHLVLCAWYWKRPVLGFWQDMVFLYKRFIRELQ